MRVISLIVIDTLITSTSICEVLGLDKATDSRVITYIYDKQLKFCSRDYDKCINFLTLQR